jgi:hypothetical protein
MRRPFWSVHPRDDPPPRAEPVTTSNLQSRPEIHSPRLDAGLAHLSGGGLGLEFRTGRVTLFASGEYLGPSDASSIVRGKGGIRVAF